MGKLLPKLTARKVEGLKEPGMHGDGEGLYLCVSVGGTKSWILRTTVYGRRRELGLGSATLVSLAEAREEARRLRKVARAGGDPETIRNRETLTFAEAAKRVHKNLEPTWSNPKHAAGWLSAVEAYAFPCFGKRPINKVGTPDILLVLEPIWTTKHETARRVMQRLSTIFDWAKVAGHYPAENPVTGVKKALGTVNTATKHMASMPWQDLPDFMMELYSREGVSARTLEFIILTATRSGEARGARWEEIDLEERAWHIPGERMKRRIPHRIPLSSAACAVLERMKGMDAEIVFPSVQTAKTAKPRVQSVNVFQALLQRMEREGFTIHGFRSTFRDWCSEDAHAEREVAEAALSHATGNEVERAYARSDLYDRRRTLMEQWGNFTTTVVNGNSAELSVGFQNHNKSESTSLSAGVKPPAVARKKLEKHRSKAAVPKR
ncbi:Integrase [Pseudorhodobacter antarcticus]|uniref:Integrase n=1 Tax=Pseudorhodobacter antarcticus TaxID=1077947 RepID=A0A1H8G0Y4_9RHOB|nr:site-specific integrase [Pseudorhodobacter antarcticus]SEN37445.1 Integrase [Pseudorhodobacter antarcticus]